MIGARVGNYRVLERVGDGGMGAVYRAVDEMLDREVALKVMRPELSRQPGLLERFRQEAVALARLSHPRIAGVYGLERQADDLVMVMEFVRGETLEQVVQRSGRIAWARAFELGSEILDGLGHAHAKGVVHRDIKPANLMLARDGHVKVMDFGIARILGRSRQTRAGASVGTPVYMSPEQLRGEEVDGRSDLYSLGAVLYELITGQLPFEADSDFELMMKQLNEPAPPVRKSIADAPQQVDEILQRTMAKAPSARFPDAASMAAALRQAIAAAASSTPTPRATPATRLVVTDLPATHGDPAGPPRPQPLAETRLSSTAESPVLPTRHPAPLAPTRIAADEQPALAQTNSWMRDWRPWTLVAAGALIAALALRRDDVPGPGVRADSLQPDTSAAAPRDSVPVLAQRGAPPAPRVPATGSPVPSAGGGLAPTTGSTPAPPARSPEGSRGQAAPAAAGATASPVRGEVKEQSVSPTPPPPGDSAPVRRPSESSGDERASAAIGSAIADFAAAVGRGDAGRVSDVLRGEVSERWLALMREGRLSMTAPGAPALDIEGSRATARFGAELNVRSAFGANRKRTAQFVAELTRGGSGWRLISVRPAGRLNLD